MFHISGHLSNLVLAYFDEKLGLGQTPPTSLGKMKINDFFYKGSPDHRTFAKGKEEKVRCFQGEELGETAWARPGANCPNLTCASGILHALLSISEVL